jgi:hypothetical protein
MGSLKDILLSAWAAISTWAQGAWAFILDVIAKLKDMVS